MISVQTTLSPEKFLQIVNYRRKEKREVCYHWPVGCAIFCLQGVDAAWTAIGYTVQWAIPTTLEVLLNIKGVDLTDAFDMLDGLLITPVCLLASDVQCGVPDAGQQRER